MSWTSLGTGFIDRDHAFRTLDRDERCVQCRNALQKLAELLPDEVTRKKADGSEEKIPLDTVKKNDRLIVRAGDKIPTDGIIKEGQPRLMNPQLR